MRRRGGGDSFVSVTINERQDFTSRKGGGGGYKSLPWIRHENDFYLGSQKVSHHQIPSQRTSVSREIHQGLLFNPGFKPF